MHPFSPLTMLLIDDDSEDGELLKVSMHKINPSIQFLQVYDGWDAIMHLQKLIPSALPALIVLDINMRIINGFEFLKVIKGEEQYKDIPVIVYSTSKKKEDKDLSLALGALHYFSKPDTTLGLQEVADAFASFLPLPLVDTM